MGFHTCKTSLDTALVVTSFEWTKISFSNCPPLMFTYQDDKSNIAYCNLALKCSRGVDIASLTELLGQSECLILISPSGNHTKYTYPAPNAVKLFCVKVANGAGFAFPLLVEKSGTSFLNHSLSIGKQNQSNSESLSTISAKLLYNYCHLRSSMKRDEFSA